MLGPLVAEPELVAERCSTRSSTNRREVFVPRWYRIAPLAQALAPGLVARVGSAWNPSGRRLRFPHGVRCPPPTPFRSPSSVPRCAASCGRSERNARAAGLTPQRYLLLLMIKGAPDQSEQSTVTELAERLQLAQSTVTELVSRAEEIGLVERERSSEDGRIAILRLTPEGERRLAQVFTSNERERQALGRAFEHLQATGLPT